MQIDINLLVAILAAIALVAGGYGTARVSTRTATYKRIAHLESRVDLLEKDREADRDYIGVLKGHIWAKLPPPPPSRPSPRRTDMEAAT